MKALRYPDHFPPKDRWGKFFLGVRWLGPDISFFSELRKEQGRRSAQEMVVWGRGTRQDIAVAISKALARQLGWKSEVFLPEDSVAVAFYGPHFDFTDPMSAFEDVLEVLERDFDIVMSEVFWKSQSDKTFGEFVDALLIRRGA